MFLFFLLTWLPVREKMYLERKILSRKEGKKRILERTRERMERKTEKRQASTTRVFFWYVNLLPYASEDCHT